MHASYNKLSREKKNPNGIIEMHKVREIGIRLTRYLDEDGAHNMTSLKDIRQNARELWSKTGSVG